MVAMAGEIRKEKTARVAQEEKNSKCSRQVIRGRQTEEH